MICTTCGQNMTYDFEDDVYACFSCERIEIPPDCLTGYPFCPYCNSKLMFIGYTVLYPQAYHCPSCNVRFSAQELILPMRLLCADRQLS